MPKPRLVPPAMVPPAMPSGVLSHIANDQWVMMTTQWVMMTTRNTILTAKSLSWTKPGTCESGRLRGQIYTSTGKRAKSVHLGWCRSLSGTRRRHGPNLVDRAVRIPLFPGWQIALRPPHHHDIHNAEPMFGEPRSTIVALPKGAMLRTGSGIPSTWVALMSLSKYGGSGRRWKKCTNQIWSACCALPPVKQMLL